MIRSLWTLLNKAAKDWRSNFNQSLQRLTKAFIEQTDKPSSAQAGTELQPG
ncbi:hypothetical protein ABQZ69_20345 [Xanthomonas sp. WHRI 8391]|uniref:hypothetical protein n=1 Tax=Xanthomonas TaxID=338 RepID=UPI001A24F0EE|nr:hypothetical protein [Xanthomonas hortorum]MBG3849805.1 hypothetical protein [Xanthomonas hortorum pv. carotae]UTS73288.1 hypothetical protein NMB96_23260 [Xanthomonas hortorum]